jgi:SAM-dependent methyltransferase
VKPWTPEGLSATFGAAAAVAWALRAGLFERLLDAPRPLSSLSDALGCDPRALDAVLGVLDAMGLTETAGDRVTLRAEVADALAVSPGGRGELAMWGALEDFVTSGRSFMPKDGASRDGVYAHVVRALERRFAPAAEALAAHVGPARGPILDVGAGSGVWSLSMATRDPEATVTALDGHETCEVFLSRAKERGLGERVETLPGDYHEAPLPAARFARIVLGNVLHLETHDRAASLVRRLRPALRPGGEFVVVDAVRDAADEHALMVAVYRMHLTMRVEGGAVYERADFEGWMREVGLSELAWHALPPGGLWALSAGAP